MKMAFDATAYPFGLGLFLLLAYPLAQRIKKMNGEQSPLPDHDAQLRERCLHLGHLASLISVGIWTIVGIMCLTKLQVTAHEMLVGVLASFVVIAGLRFDRCGISLLQRNCI